MDCKILSSLKFTLGSIEKIPILIGVLSRRLRIR